MGKKLADRDKARSEIQAKRREKMSLRKRLSQGYSVLESGTLAKFHLIDLSDISPFGSRPLDVTIYVMGSLGAGKTCLLEMLEGAINGARLAKESGVENWFVARFLDYYHRHGHLDRGCRLPFIDGLRYCDGNKLDWGAIGRPFRAGPDALEERAAALDAYREAKSHIRTGGKSAFPDRLFYPFQEEARQVIALPGHLSLNKVNINRSLPKLDYPDAVIYLVDPDASEFKVGLGSGSGAFRYQDLALERCAVNLRDMESLEAQGVPVHWFLSKTLSKEKEARDRHPDEKERRESAMERYSRFPSLERITDAIPTLPAFDSFDMAPQELIKVFGGILFGDYAAKR
ncbi:hypothetical protein HYU14_00180 [Candidatus Woesearchaeota archaeon]|nr:hypothetical protein [Candidatus Woesearchaeota archaeon]